MSERAEIDHPHGGGPWRDEKLMRRLYVEEGLSANQLQKRFDCSPATIRKWLDRHGIKRRTRSEAAQNWRGTLGCASYRVNNWGHVICGSEKDELMLHRLLAASEWGFDALHGKHVHHKNGIPWDNRIENLELVTNEEHASKHRKVDGLDRVRIAELYEHGDISSRDLADHVDHDISQNTVLNIHDEFYGGDSGA